MSAALAPAALAPAAWPRGTPEQDWLLRLDPRTGRMHDARVSELPGLLEPGDLLVVNDAATLPASLRGWGPAGQALELRLVGEREDGSWDAVLFGPGDWRMRTEDRPAPAGVYPGAHLSFGVALWGTVEWVDADAPRLVRVRFGQEGPAFWSALYRAGRPVQYSYLKAALHLWDVQTTYASRPWAVELPSAGRPLVGSVLAGLARRGIRVATLTHAAGLSSTGDPSLDARLPLPERFEVPAATVEAVEAAHAAGGRLVAVGTTVVRALEGSAVLNAGVLRPGRGVTDLRIGRGFRPRLVDGVLTGMHQPGESHFELLEAFAPGDALRQAVAHAESLGYLAHEFGDSLLVLPALPS
jgi:S-adenosylmethionine:tRNA ribosyltransferase-isomerase